MGARKWEGSAWKLGWSQWLSTPRSRFSAFVIGIGLTVVAIKLIDAGDLRALAIGIVSFVTTYFVACLVALIGQRNAARDYIGQLETGDIRVRDILALKASGQILMNAYHVNDHSDDHDDPLVKPALEWLTEVRSLSSRYWFTPNHFGHDYSAEHLRSQWESNPQHGGRLKALNAYGVMEYVMDNLGDVAGVLRTSARSGLSPES